MVQNFANRYLPENQPLTSKFVSALFQLKTNLLGGSNEQVTLGELTILRTKVSIFSQIVTAVGSDMATVLNPSAASPDERRKAAGAITRVTPFLIQFFNGLEGDLKWETFEKFTQELNHWLNTPEQNAEKTLNLVQDALPVIQRLKVYVVGGSLDAVETQKWTPLIENIASNYATYLNHGALSAEFLDLHVQFSSTDQEKQDASHALTGYFLKLQKKTLRSAVWADYWAKSLMASALLAPDQPGVLALHRLQNVSKLGQRLVRMIAPFTDGPAPAETSSLDFEKIPPLLRHLNGILQNVSPAAKTPLAFSELKKLLDQIGPLFQNGRTDLAYFDDLLTLAKGAKQILIGGSPGSITAQEWSPLIQKISTLFRIFQLPDLSKTAQIHLALQELLKAPALETLNRSELELLASTVKNRWSEKFTWNASIIKTFLNVKAALIGGSSDELNTKDLLKISQIITTWNNTSDLSQTLQVFAEMREIKPEQEFPIKKWIIHASDFYFNLFPEKKDLHQKYFDSEFISIIKPLLLGGSSERITQIEWKILAANLNSLLSAAENLTEVFTSGHPIDHGRSLLLLEKGLADINLHYQSLVKINPKWEGISTDSLTDAFSYLLTKMGYPGSRDNIQKVTEGLTFRFLKKPKEAKHWGAQDIQTFTQFIHRWTQGQKILEKAYIKLAQDYLQTTQPNRSERIPPPPTPSRAWVTTETTWFTCCHNCNLNQIPLT